MRMHLLRALLTLAILLPQTGWASPAAGLYTTDSVGTAPAVPAPAAPEGFFSDTGGPDGRGTILPDYWLNKFGGEISNAIQGRGIPLDLNNRTQLLGLLNAHGFSSIGSGTGNFTVPSGVTLIQVRLWGGGAGGGYGGAGAADGGSGAGYGEMLLTVSPGQVIAYSVASSAAGGTSGTPVGTDGDTSTFGTGRSPGPYMVCNGGLGGNAGVSGSSPASRSSSTAGLVSIALGGYAQRGGAGHKGDAYTASGRTGAGGASFAGEGGVEQLLNAGFDGNFGSGPGTGGAGGGVGRNGGAGVGGILLINW